LEYSMGMQHLHMVPSLQGRWVECWLELWPTRLAFWGIAGKVWRCVSGSFLSFLSFFFPINDKFNQM